MKSKTQFREISLTVSISKEGKSFVAYAPALDISTYGATLAEAKNNFEELVDIFFEELETKEATDNVLASLGWTINNKQYNPPVEVEHKVETFRVPVFA